MRAFSDTFKAWLVAFVSSFRRGLYYHRQTCRLIEQGWLAFVLALCGTGCAAGGINAARQTIANTAQVQAKAFRALTKFDAEMQKQIVDEAIAKGQVDQGKKDLAEYRNKRNVAVDALKYAAFATLQAEVALQIGAAAKTGGKDYQGWLKEITQAMVKVYTAFQALGWKRVGLGGLFP